MSSTTVGPRIQWDVEARKARHRLYPVTAFYSLYFLAVLAFAFSSNTRGNAATEIVKYFLQLHYHLDVDLRRPDLLRRGNFYGGN